MTLSIQALFLLWLLRWAQQRRKINISSNNVLKVRSHGFSAMHSCLFKSSDWTGRPSLWLLLLFSSVAFQKSTLVFMKPCLSNSVLILKGTCPICSVNMFLHDFTPVYKKLIIITCHWGLTDNNFCMCLLTKSMNLNINKEIYLTKCSWIDI